MRHRKIAGMAIVCIFLVGLSIAGLDKSGDTTAENLSMSEFSTLMPSDVMQSPLMGEDIPSATASAAGTELAAYTNQAPPEGDVGTLMPASTQSNPPMYMYNNGDYVPWNDFIATFPSNQPGLWIERAVSWSQYATLPLGGWARELLYVPSGSPVTMYEVYPFGFVRGYDLGYVLPGYYYIWYYADMVGRHRCMFVASNAYSNEVVVDVYYSPLVPPRPPKPDPRIECESHSTCHYTDGNCYCTGLIDDPARHQCEVNPTCDYVDGECHCKGLKPEDPEKAICEENSQCTWSNGQCFCFGFNPEQNPEPSPSPTPLNPTPSPVADCESNPSCHWSDSGCHCTGLLSNGSSSDGDTTTSIQTM
jgi:hypothetical protein